MKMENELPKIDLPEDVLVDVLTDSVILNLYAHFPCRIKAEILVLCKKGDIDAWIIMSPTIHSSWCCPEVSSRSTRSGGM